MGRPLRIEYPGAHYHVTASENIGVSPRHNLQWTSGDVLVYLSNLRSLCGLRGTFLSIYLTLRRIDIRCFLH